MEIHFYVLYVLSGISIILGALALYKIKTAIYLLEQPVVKKMSPQLNLKPIKVDQVDGDTARNQPRSNGTSVGRGPGRPEGRDDRPPREGSRDGRDRAPRSDREGSGDRGPRPEGDRGPRSDRGDRGDRFGGRDRDRGPRNDRGDRGDRGDRPPRREFSGSEREPAQADAAPRPAAAPSADHSAGAPLAPRRPLPSTVDHDAEHKPTPISEMGAPAVNEVGAADPFFGRDDSDIQHGRRTQLKKKPKFEADEVEEKAPTEETKAL